MSPNEADKTLMNYSIQNFEKGPDENGTKVISSSNSTI